MIVSVITCIAAPNAEVEAVVLKSLEATRKEFLNDRLLAAIDIGTPAIENFLQSDGWEIVRPYEGHPPRVGSLLRRCIETCDTSVVWTVEHDAVIWAGTRDWVTDALLSIPKAAGIEARCLHRTERDNRRPHLDGDRNLIQEKQISLNCVAWRAEALRTMDWSTSVISEFGGPGCSSPDAAISIYLRKNWNLYRTVALCCDHLQAEARTAIEEAIRQGMRFE